MEWFLKLPAEVQIPIIGLLGSVIAIVGIMVNARFGNRNPAKEQEYKRPPMEVRLSDQDRSILHDFRQAIHDHGEEIGRHREEMIRNSSRNNTSPGRRSG